ncbi:MAG: hypothetical protein MUP74_02585 [Desulfobacterales bacterium]|nr:hypothetical protein [Desulfobacterales bacterium]
MHKTLLAAMVCLGFLFVGCAPTYQWISRPESQAAANPICDVSFAPIKDKSAYFEGFSLTVVNKTTADLTVDWQQSRYLFQGKPAGGFIFQGVPRENVNSPPADIVPAGERLTKLIYPLKLISFKPISDYKGGGSTGPSFSPGMLPDGENGLLLVVRDGGKVTRVKLGLQIVTQKTQ